MKIPQPERVTLTPTEQALFERITFDVGRDHSEKMNQETSMAAAAELAHSLFDRKAIPEIRRRYFIDPELNVGGHGKSRKDNFESNGTRGDAILRHPNFLKYLRYFIYGPELPPGTVHKFRQVLVDDEGTSGMVFDEMKRVARAEARQLGPKGQTDLHEEFFKLALECGVDDYEARCVRDAVLQAR